MGHVEAAKLAEDVQFLIAHWGREVDENPTPGDRLAYVSEVRARLDRLNSAVDVMAARSGISPA